MCNRLFYILNLLLFILYEELILTATNTAAYWLSENIPNKLPEKDKGA